MALSPPRRALLLDLDGVVVLETPAPDREILRLHADLPTQLAAFGWPVIVLTHRSRAEARQILAAAGLPPARLARLVAAEDLLAEALRGCRLLALARGGLRKSFALSLIERGDLIARRDLAVIDDKPGNLDDLLRHGVGAALLAPGRLSDGGAGVIGFDFFEATRLLGRWAAGAYLPEPMPLTPRSGPIAAWQRTGLSTTASSRHWFNTVRAIGFRTRIRFAGAK